MYVLQTLIFVHVLQMMCISSTCPHPPCPHLPHISPTTSPNSQLQSALGFWKTLFAQTACIPRCQSIIFGQRFRQCVQTNNLYNGNFQDLFESNVCNGACLYANKAVWQPLTNATGPCTGLSTQPQAFACPSGCASLLSLVPAECRAVASSVQYQGYGDFLYVFICVGGGGMVLDSAWVCVHMHTYDVHGAYI